jgi:hypothetical protein
MFTDEELRAGAALCIIGDTIRRELWGSRPPLGEPLRVRKFSCEVVGVLASKGQGAMGNDQDDIVLVPLNTLQRRVTGNTRVSTLLVSMKDEISALVQESIRVGTEIPAQFKPLIEELIRTGQLLDENGEAITDIGQLQFGAPLVSEVDKIIAKIDELIQALTTGLVGAFDAVGRVRIPPIKIPYEFEATNELPTGGSVPSYAGGTGGFVNFGAGTLAMLHGYEAVVPRGQAAPGGGSAPVIITVISQLDGKEVARNQVRYLPNQLALAGV